MVAGQHPGDPTDQGRDEDQLEDEDIHRQDFKVVGHLFPAVVDLADNEQHDRHHPQQQGQFMHSGKNARDPGYRG